MNELALFAGVGGGLLGSRLLGWSTVCAVEKEPYCREVLLRRQRDGLLDLFPIWDDVRTFDGREWCGAVDIVTAGFPCQPFSNAGKRLGELDERNLWPETVRVIGEVQPRWCLLENVPALLSSGYFGRILTDLAEVGLDARWGVLSAAGVGAPHIRKRLWIVAYSSVLQRQAFKRNESDGILSIDVADAPGTRQHTGQSKPSRASRDEARLQEPQRRSSDVTDSNSNAENGIAEPRNKCSWWNVEPDVGRVADGVALRVDRLRAIGNGEVPAVAARAWILLNGTSQE